MSKLNETKKKLDAVSPSFCLAKWLQVTLHLQNGHTHSCHHPNTHKIPIEELSNPSALHNTKYKKQLREQMLAGVRPEECHYCWNLEDAGSFSDRTFKSADCFACDKFDKVIDYKLDNINPSSLEVSFDYTCNLKCAYCAPHISSKWMEEVKQYGGYPTTRKFNNLEHIKQQDKMPIPNREDNPYIEAFWEWWPDLVDDLYDFRITGGEPLLSNDLWKVLDYLEANPKPNLRFAINTNMSVPFNLIEKFTNKVKILSEKKCIKTLEVYTSIDTVGPQAEYIRYGLNYTKFQNNIKYFLENTKPLHKIQLSFMITVNALSMSGLLNLMKYILELKSNYGNISIDTPYLNHPYHMSVRILTKEFTHYIEDAIMFARDNQSASGFSQNEVMRLERILIWMEADNIPFDLNEARKDFVLFFNEYDRRKGTSFAKVFPEYKEFWELCTKC